MDQALAALKTHLPDLSAVLDVGVHRCTPALIKAFPDRFHYLFEPVVEFAPDIAKAYAGLEYELIPKAVSDGDGPGQQAYRFDTPSHDTVIASQVVEGEFQPRPKQSVRPVERIRLDTFIHERVLPGGLLLKVDVDGHEAAVLKGLERAADRVDVLILETSLRDFPKRYAMVADLGFMIRDIVDLCYYFDTLAQVDLVCVREDLFAQAGRSPFHEKDLDFRHWRRLTPTSA
ncbi:MAG: FkbM family methyltransferase [Maricaulaceae bacterium]